MAETRQWPSCQRTVFLQRIILQPQSRHSQLSCLLSSPFSLNLSCYSSNMNRCELPFSPWLACATCLSCCRSTKCCWISCLLRQWPMLRPQRGFLRRECELPGKQLSALGCFILCSIPPLILDAKVEQSPNYQVWVCIKVDSIRFLFPTSSSPDLCICIGYDAHHWILLTSLLGWRGCGFTLLNLRRTQNFCRCAIFWGERKRHHVKSVTPCGSDSIQLNRNHLGAIFGWMEVTWLSFFLVM